MQNIQRSFVIPLSDREHVQGVRYLVMADTAKDAAIAAHAEVSIEKLYRLKSSAMPADRALYEDWCDEWQAAEDRLWAAQRVREMGLADDGGNLDIIALAAIGALILLIVAGFCWPAIAAAWHSVSGWGFSK